MALIHIDGCDHYVTADGLKKWSLFGTGVSITAAGRRGSGAVSFNGNTRSASKLLPSNYSTLIVGWALDCAGANTAECLRFQDGATVHVSLRVTATNAIAAYRGALTTLLGTSANAVVPASGYSYIEAKVFISDTVGTVDVRINGASVLSLTGLDTRNAGDATVNTVNFRGVGIVTTIDDIYICDTSGSTNNDFLGDVRVDTIYPTSDGNYSQFTPSTGSTHYVLVDETAPNTTDHNDGDTVGHRDSYGMGNLAALVSQVVYGVQVNTAVLKDDAGSKSAASFVRSGTTNADGASRTLGTSQTYVTQVFEQDPAAVAAWTETTVNAMEAGVLVTA